MIGQKLIEAAGSGISTADVAEAIDFDGANDYLSSSSLTGAADGKTFTLSFFIWMSDGNTVLDFGTGSQGRFRATVDNSAITIEGFNAGGSKVLEGLTLLNPAPFRTFLHVLISVNLTSSANRSVYINDVLTSTTWSFYSNADIDFTTTVYRVSAQNDGSASSKFKGRLSNIFLDYTYRDLSVEANRRLFVTADLKPAAGQASLNPILYLPMDDPTQPGRNDGTGGDFTLTGTVARSGRGPNQYNAPYSTFDGTNDYLTHGTLPVAATKVLTLSVCVTSSLAANVAGTIFYTRNSSTSTGIELRYFTYAGGDTGFYLEMQNAAGSNIFTGYVPKITTTASGRNYILTLCIDMDSQSACRAYINGVSQSLTISNFTAGQTIRATNRASIAVTADFIGNFYNPFKGGIGAFWFNPTYIDLSVAANREKFVTGTGIDAKPVDLGANGELPTGTSPLIYLPMYGNKAGKNYGTGGDFTVNSGPYTGARGPNEFWGNLADFSGSTSYLSIGFSGGAAGKTFSLSFYVLCDVTSTLYGIFHCQNSGGDIRIQVSRTTTNRLEILARNSSNSTILNVLTSASFASTTVGKYVQVCIDLSSSANRSVYIDGVLDTPTWTTYTNDFIPFNTFGITDIGKQNSGQYLNGKLSEFYFTTDYIDFSQEANRLKFRDAFGNPVDLTPQIEAGDIPNPAIYMRFDPASFGTNSGTLGDFIVSGTITDGGQL